VSGESGQATDMCNGYWWDIGFRCLLGSKGLTGSAGRWCRRVLVSIRCSAALSFTLNLTAVCFSSDVSGSGTVVGDRRPALW
jgi:hypothetical protein